MSTNTSTAASDSQVRTAIGWSAIHVWGTQLTNLLVFIVLARLLSPAIFGIVALAAVFVSFAKSFVDQGLSTAVIQRSDISAAQLDSVFWMSLAIGLAFALLGALIAKPVATIFAEPVLASVIRWISLLFVIEALGTVHQALLRKRFEFRALALRGLLAIAIGGLIGVFMAWKGWGVFSLVAQQLTTALVGGVMLWALESWRPHARFLASDVRELLGFGYNIVGIRMVTFASRRSDDLIIGIVLGTVALGYYTIAYKIYKVLLDVLGSVIARVALPTFARLQRDGAAFRESVIGAISLVALVTFPVFVGVAISAPDIVNVFFGAQWLPSAPVMRVLALAGLTQCVTLVFQQAFIAYSRPDLALKVMSVATAAMLVGYLVASPFGIVWVAGAFGIVGALFLPAQVAILRRLVGFGFSDLWVACRSPLIGLAWMCAGLLVQQVVTQTMMPGLRVALTVTLGAICYSAGIVLSDARRRRRVWQWAALPLDRRA